MKKQKSQNGQIKLPRGTTANERAKKRITIRSRELGPLESLQVKAHCEMCGAHQDLEAAFNPAGKPMTLCFPCRIGSAESLAEHYRKIYPIANCQRFWLRFVSGSGH